MPDDPKQGLFYPGPQAAAAAAVPGAPAEAAAEVPAAEAKATKSRIPRRLAIRWAGWGSILLLLAGWANGFLSFFYPRKTGAFGGTLTAGNVDDFKVGDVKVVTEGKFYVTRVPEGFIALWWKCPHLGCTVPWKENEPAIGHDVAFAEKGQFHCPCHGSQYDRYGQIVAGPAPRPMDRFPITIEGGKIRVETGPSKAIVRAKADPSDAVPA